MGLPIISSRGNTTKHRYAFPRRAWERVENQFEMSLGMRLQHPPKDEGEPITRERSELIHSKLKTQHLKLLLVIGVHLRLNPLKRALDVLGYKR